MKTWWVVGLLAVTGCAARVAPAGSTGGDAPPPYGQPTSPGVIDPLPVVTEEPGTVAKDPACSRGHYDTKACDSVTDCDSGPEYNCFWDVDDYKACGCISDGGCGIGFRCTVQVKPGEPVEYPGACVPVSCPN